MVRRLAQVAVLALFAVCQAGVTSPSLGLSSAPSIPDISDPPTLTISADASLATEDRIEGRFTSARYGYAWTLPAGWSVTETPGSGGVHPGEPGLDTFTDGRGSTITVGVTAVAASQQLALWICPVVAHLESVHGEPREAVAAVTLGGVPATISTFHFVAPPYRVLELEVQAIRGTNGFFLSWTDTLVPVVADPDQMTRFEQLLTGFSFAPG